ncbi:MAG: hypothetical protein ACTHJL_05870, partial [Amnibacterium sp.]
MGEPDVDGRSGSDGEGDGEPDAVGDGDTDTVGDGDAVGEPVGIGEWVAIGVCEATGEDEAVGADDAVGDADDDGAVEVEGALEAVGDAEVVEEAPPGTDDALVGAVGTPAAEAVGTADPVPVGAECRALDVGAVVVAVADCEVDAEGPPDCSAPVVTVEVTDSAWWCRSATERLGKATPSTTAVTAVITAVPPTLATTATRPGRPWAMRGRAFSIAAGRRSERGSRMGLRCTAGRDVPTSSTKDGSGSAAGSGSTAGSGSAAGSGSTDGSGRAARTASEGARGAGDA